MSKITDHQRLTMLAAVTAAIGLGVDRPLCDRLVSLPPVQSEEDRQRRLSAAADKRQRRLAKRRPT